MAFRQQRIRGAEATIRLMQRIGVVVLPLEGSFFKVRDFQWSDDGEIRKDDFLGEKAPDIDYQGDGFSGSFSIDKANNAATIYVSTLVASDQASIAPPEIFIVVTYKYRTFGLSPTIQTFSEAVMKMATETVAGRKEFITNAFEWTAKTRI